MIRGGNDVFSRQGSLWLFYAQFNGRGASNGACAPILRADGGQLCKDLTFTRTGAGLYTLQHVPPAPSAVNQGFPSILSVLGALRSAAFTLAQFTPGVYTPSTGTITMKITTPSTAAAYDPVNGETIELLLSIANSVVP